MRSTLDICIAVSENEPATDQELRYALQAMGSINHFIKQDLRLLIEAVLDGKPTAKMRAEFARGTLDRMFNGQKMPVDEWLGPGNIPGSPEQQERLRVGKAIFKKATGLDL